jgi:hypothetical protein
VCEERDHAPMSQFHWHVSALAAIVVTLAKRWRIGLGRRRVASRRSSVGTKHHDYWPGIVNLPRVGRHDGRCDDWSESSRRILGEFGEFAPFNEPGCELCSIE